MPDTRVSALQRAVFDSPRWAFLAVMAGITLVKTGLWFFPNTWLVVDIAVDPFRDPFPPEYLGHDAMWTWLVALVAHVLQATTVPGYVLLNAAFAAGFVAVVVWSMFARLPERLARTGTIVFAMLPASWLGFYGIGPDGLTLLLVAVALVGAARWWLVVPSGVLLGMQHAELALVGAFAVILSDIAARRWGGGPSRIDWRFGVRLAASVIVGRLLLMGIFAITGIGMPGNRLDWIEAYGGVLAVRAYLGWPWLLWSVLGIAWLVAALDLRRGKPSLSLLLPLAALVLLTPMVYDQTRVLAIAVLPLAYRCWLSDRGFLRSIGPRNATRLVVVWAVVPTIFVLGAEPFGSVLPYSLALLSHWLTGSPPIPADLGMWPFG